VLIENMLDKDYQTVANYNSLSWLFHGCHRRTMNSNVNAQSHQRAPCAMGGASLALHLTAWRWRCSTEITGQHETVLVSLVSDRRCRALPRSSPTQVNTGGDVARE
jgi:hypothetical protein